MAEARTLKYPTCLLESLTSVRILRFEHRPGGKRARLLKFGSAEFKRLSALPHVAIDVLCGAAAGGDALANDPQGQALAEKIVAAFGKVQRSVGQRLRFLKISVVQGHLRVKRGMPRLVHGLLVRIEMRSPSVAR